MLNNTYIEWEALIKGVLYFMRPVSRPAYRAKNEINWKF